MQLGKILVAHHEGAFVVKLVGDVRLTLCTTIDEYFGKMFSSPNFVGVIVDLTEAEGIDSTSLGLLAKLAVRAQNSCQLPPMILSPNPNISRLLESMGFNSVFDIRASLHDHDKNELEQLLDSQPKVTELTPAADCDNEQCVRNKVIEAHRVLMDLNEKNRAEFSDLVKTLETSR
jgi:anti-anti-sigma factor